MAPTTTTRGASHAVRRILALTLAILSCGVIAGTAAAGTHHETRVAGTYAVTEFGDTSCVSVSAVVLRCTTKGLKSVYEGDLTGDTTSDFDQVINCATGRTIGQGIETFSGTVRGGQAGTLKWRILFAADFDCTTFYPTNFHALSLITQATGGLSGMGGVLRFGDVAYDGLLR